MSELSQADLQRIFVEQIVPDLFHRSHSESAPSLILVGAQPGAGKTRAGELAIRESRREVVSIIGDDLRLFHPEYRELTRKTPSEMPAATAQASGKWVEMAISYAAEHRISAHVEGTWRNPDTPLGTALMFKERGFRVEAHLVAVPPEESRLSTAERFIADDQKNGFGRITPPAAHDTAFAGVKQTLDALCAAGSPADRMVVRKRSSVLLFDVQRSSAGGAIRGALDSAQGEWNRKLTAAEVANHRRRAKTARRYLEMHHPNDEEVKNLIVGLGFGVQYLELTASAGPGDVVVRGHQRNNHAVSPHTRSRPTR